MPTGLTIVMLSVMSVLTPTEAGAPIPEVIRAIIGDPQAKTCKAVVQQLRQFESTPAGRFSYNGNEYSFEECRSMVELLESKFDSQLPAQHGRARYYADDHELGCVYLCRDRAQAISRRGLAHFADHAPFLYWSDSDDNHTLIYSRDHIFPQTPASRATEEFFDILAATPRGQLPRDWVSRSAVPNAGGSRPVASSSPAHSAMRADIRGMDTTSSANADLLSEATSAGAFGRHPITGRCLHWFETEEAEKQRALLESQKVQDLMAGGFDRETAKRIEKRDMDEAREAERRMWRRARGVDPWGYSY